MPPPADPQAGPEHDQMAIAIQNILASAQPPVTPQSIAFSPSPYASSHFLVDVAVATHGQLLHLVMKDLRSPTLAAEAARPTIPSANGREADVYRTALANVEGPPHFYGALRDGPHHWLLLERVRGRELTKVGDRRTWGLAARWLGTLHASNRSWVKQGLFRDEHYMSESLQRARPGIESAPSALRLDRVIAGWDGVIESLLAIPLSMLHGDAFPANVLVGHSNRVCFVDWELAGTGPGLIDIAALTSGAWTDMDRERMVDAYASGLNGPYDRNRPKLKSDLVACRILVAVEMLGALRTWEPPSHQAWDWPAELASLADEFGL